MSFDCNIFWEDPVSFGTESPTPIPRPGPGWRLLKSLPHFRLGPPRRLVATPQNNRMALTFTSLGASGPWPRPFALFHEPPFRR